MLTYITNGRNQNDPFNFADLHIDMFHMAGDEIVFYYISVLGPQYSEDVSHSHICLSVWDD